VRIGRRRQRMRPLGMSALRLLEHDGTSNQRVLS